MCLPCIMESAKLGAAVLAFVSIAVIVRGSVEAVAANASVREPCERGGLFPCGGFAAE